MFEYVCMRCGKGPDECTLLSDEELQKLPDLEGKKACPLCKECHEKNINPVLTGRTNYMHKKQQVMSKKRDLKNGKPASKKCAKQKSGAVASKSSRPTTTEEATDESSAESSDDELDEQQEDSDDLCKSDESDDNVEPDGSVESDVD